MSALVVALLLSGGWERPIEVPEPGRSAVTLDREIYARAEDDLHDLRVYDDGGRLVPFLVDRATSGGETVLQPTFLNREFEKGRSESVTLDFGQGVPKHALVLSLSGDNFRRRVSVESSDDAVNWGTLTDDSYVFAIPGSPSHRFETIPLAENDRRYLRVRVESSEGDGKRFEIVSATALGGPARVGATEVRPAHLSRVEDPDHHESQLVVDLGVRSQPFEEIRLDVADPQFFRGVAIEARRDPPAGAEAGGPRWVPLGDRAIYRYTEKGRVLQRTSLTLVGRERALRLRVANRDDAPLVVRSASVVVPVERVVFEAAPGHQYRLRYGTGPASSPDFDLARTAGTAAAYGATAAAARLGEPRPLPPDADTRPWTERHPALLWAGLVAVVALLGGVTLRALRSA